MALNSGGTDKYDNRGSAKSALLTANNGGTSKYDNRGSAQAAIGTSSVASAPLIMMMGVGM